MTHTLVAGLGFGDESKGSVVDALCASTAVSAVVRYNGGSQAAHNVVLEDGRHHTFSQFGSGTLRGVRTHLSRYMLVNPVSMKLEAHHLRFLGIHDNNVPNPYDLLTIDEDALVITPYHVAANRWKEQQRGDHRHGSCGQGIGETQKMALDHPEVAIRMKDLYDFDAVVEKLINIAALYAYETGISFSKDPSEVARTLVSSVPLGTIVPGSVLGELLNDGPCVFEGAQGVLLDENFGFHPYTTWSTTTFANAENLLNEHGVGDADYTRLGVLRSYQTRHGAGPFPTEARSLHKTELHNTHGEWQGAWRVGHLDLVLLRWALYACDGVDELAVTHLDQAGGVKVANSYRGVEELPRHCARRGFETMNEATEILNRVKPELIGYITPSRVETTLGLIQETAQAEITMTSYGPTVKDKRMAVRV